MKSLFPIITDTLNYEPPDYVSQSFLGEVIVSDKILAEHFDITLNELASQSFLGEVIVSD